MGCTDSDTVNVTEVTVTASFDQSADTIDLKLTNSVTFVNASTGSSSWNWDFGNSSSSTDQNPATVYINTGIFTVTLISSDGSCSDTAYGKVVVINTTGLIENHFKPQIEIYPNPTKGILTIKVKDKNAEQFSMSIHNILGENIPISLKDDISKDIYEINLTNQPEGIYFLQLISGDKTVVKKFIINRQ